MSEDWSGHAIKAEQAMKRGSDALLLNHLTEGFDRYLEALKQILQVMAWVNREKK